MRAPDGGRNKPDADDSWRAEVLGRVAVLRATAESARDAATDERIGRLCGRVESLLEDTERLTRTRRRGLRSLEDWCSGGPIERAFRNIHGAEIVLAEVVGLAELSSQRPALRSMAKRVLPADDARALAIEQRLCDKVWNGAVAAKDPTLDERLRREYVAALTWVHDACDKNFTRVRSFRNIVLAATAGLAIVAIGLGILGALSPRSLPLCFDAGTLTAEDVRGAGSLTQQIVCPTGTDTGPTGGDVPLVLVVGLAAGAFAAALAVRGMRGTSTPYCVPVAIALLKLPAGAVTALFGMLMLHGAFIPGLSALDTQAQIIAYAIVFGYAQQLFTRMIDSQAQDVLDHSPSSEPGGAAIARATDPAFAGRTTEAAIT